MKEIKLTMQLGSLRSGVYPRYKGNGVAVDSFDNIFVTGTTTGNLDGATNHAGTELFIIKYNSSGVLQ